jgi:LytR cell envelope-related transcriptional attenuator
VDHPLPSSDALVRPWRTATIVASAIAAVELVALVVAGVALLAKPLARHLHATAEAKAFQPVAKHAARRPHKAVIPPKAKERPPQLSRRQTEVLVLNGNGQSGAAGTAASRLHRRGYTVGATANAKRSDYASNVVMYRTGFRPEGLRLARDLHVKIVGPLDGMSRRDLQGARLVLILGAR